MQLYYKPLRCNKRISFENGIQIVDARLVAEKEHVEHAIAQAIKAFKRGKNIARDILVEVLVRLSGQRQIKYAIEKFGLKSNVQDVVVISTNKNRLEEFKKKYSCRELGDILKIDENKFNILKKTFDISDREIEIYKPKDFKEKVEILKRLIIEKIALLNLD